MFDVISIGSATLDVYLKSSQFHLVNADGKLSLCESFNEKIDVDDAAVSSGGGATNTAVGFSRLGLSSTCIAEIGEDFAGQIVEQDLIREGVDTSFLVKEKGEKTAVASLLISSDGARTALVHRGAARMLTASDIAWENVKTRWIHLSSVGSVEVIENVMRFCTKNNILLSWNPGNWEIDQIKKGLLVPDWKSVHILCVNKQEMEELSGEMLSTDEAWKKEWCFDGPQITIITDGKNGGRYCVEGKCYWYESIPTQVVQETGAGDGFICGVVAGILLGKELKDAIELGKKEASSVVGQMGAKTGLLRQA